MQGSNSGAKTSTHHRWRVHLLISQHRWGCSTRREGRMLLGGTVTGHIYCRRGLWGGRGSLGVKAMIAEQRQWDGQGSPPTQWKRKTLLRQATGHPSSPLMKNTRERNTQSVWGACHTDQTWILHPTCLACGGMGPAAQVVYNLLAAKLVEKRGPPIREPCRGSDACSNFICWDQPSDA